MINRKKLVKHEDKKYYGAYVTPLKDERMKVAWEYANMCNDDIASYIHAMDFEAGAIFGNNQMKQAIIQWLRNNVKDFDMHIDISNLLYEVQ